MSTEPDYNFNEPAAAASAGPSLGLPFALVTCTLAIFMFAQTVSVRFTKTNLEENKTQLIEGKRQLAELYNNRKPQVAQAQEIQKKLNDLVLDLLLLAKTDKEAQGIVNKYNIVQQPPAGASGEAPAPAPAPAP
jgi:hypothetical protein